MKQIFTPALGAIFMLSAFTGKAQMTNCNVFLKGNHLEVGINPSGAYGSTINAPAGFHARVNAGAAIPGYYFNPGCSTVADSCSLNLGFVADPGLTNWSNYFGDYYLPGMPQEGWAIQVGSNSATSYTPAFMATALGTAIPATLDVVPGANTAHNVVGGRVSGTWVGMYDSIQITQVTSLDTGGLYFKVDVQFTNLAVAPKDSVYYMRTIDPDNEYGTTGSFTTINNVEHQATTSSDLVLVSAVGTTDTMSYMALGTHDSRAKSFVVDFGLSPYNRIDSVYNGTTTYQYSGSSTNDAGIGLVFNIGHLATVDSASDSVTLAKSPLKHPANSKTISFVYAFKSGVIDTMASTIAGVGITAIANNSSIRVMPNPAHNIATISGLNSGEVVYIYDLTGREVLRNDAGRNGMLTVNTEGLSTGIYILVVKDQLGRVVSRVKIEKN